MYEQHFNLRQKPFRLTPELNARYGEPSQQIALNTIELALADGEGFIKVVGEVGLGKTLLCRALLSRLKPPFVTAWIPDPQLSPGSLQQLIVTELGVCLPSRSSLQKLHQLLQTRLLELVAEDKQPVLLIDEAQALPPKTLEAVRLLTNLETERRKLLQVVLFGQPELDHRLAQPDMRQLRQRITFSCRLEPLSQHAVAEYIHHRTAAAGAEEPLFTPAATRRIARASSGVPRLINVLCHKALLAAWGRGLPRAGLTEAKRAIADTESVGPTPLPWPSRLMRASVVVGVAIAAWTWLAGWPGAGA